MEIKSLYNIFIESTGVTTDSRNITAGSIFFALKGDTFDGNSFAMSALEAGAAYAVVDSQELDRENERLIFCENVLETLQSLARYHRRSLGIPVVGLTGTNGKTTTKELISAVLSIKYNVAYTKGNLNNHIGVPLTLLGMTKEHEIAVIEMGASAPGEITTLTSICQPNIGLITNVGKAHLLGFGSFDGVKKTKGELYDFLCFSEGTILFNQDNPHLSSMVAERCASKALPYGIEYEGYTVATPCAQSPFLQLTTKSGITVQSNLIGSYNADNVAAAIAVGRFFGVSESDCAKAIKGYLPSNNRSMLVKGKSNTLIVDAYNANPTSMRAALENFASMEGSSKILIIGDMLELGNDSAKEHREIATLALQLGFKDIYCVGAEFSNNTKDIFEESNVRFFPDSAVLKEHLEVNTPKGSLILIKGSRGTRLERVIEIL